MAFATESADFLHPAHAELIWHVRGPCRTGLGFSVEGLVLRVEGLGLVVCKEKRRWERHAKYQIIRGYLEATMIVEGVCVVLVDRVWGTGCRDLSLEYRV